MAGNCKKLIETAMPIKEISAESVRDKSIRHGHISTLHLWWARRPLPVCRAVVFASLVPDPLDENCPQAFKDAIEILLGKENNPGDPYSPYQDIPWTAVYDPMEDNLRNRLQMFIGKFTDEMQQHLLHHKPKPGAKDQLSDFSLIKWDNKNNETIINKARKLIWVAHNSQLRIRNYELGIRNEELGMRNVKELLSEFDTYYNAIKDAERELYALRDRHIETDAVKKKEAELHNAIEAFLDKMPRVFDPFAGGGAIPLEAARLGCRSFGNDINPVAHIIQKGSLEFPQKYGKPITYSKREFEKLYGREALVKWCTENGKHADADNLKIEIPNRLSFDVEFYAKKLLAATEKEIGHFYPSAVTQSGAEGKPIAYYWARVGTCSNPSCRAEVPLLKGFYLANTGSKQVYLKPIIKGKKIDFEIHKGKYGLQGWLNKSLICPCCGASTPTSQLKEQAINGGLKERLVAIIDDTKEGKNYRLPTNEEIQSSKIDKALLNQHYFPNEKMLKIPDLVSGRGWGIEKWSDLFSPRQLLALQTLVQQLEKIKTGLHPEKDDYAKAVVTYLGILMDRIAVANTSFGVWHTGGEKLERIMGRQAIPMVFDYPESNPFCNSSGSALNQLDWITRYIESECQYPFHTELKNASSGDKTQFTDKYITATVTDPPYYDAIAYADLSDFFYVWLKRTLSDIYPLNFATPQTPKSDECTALKHHHNGNLESAKNHFENKLLEIFNAIEHQASDLVSIMFAHQSTEAWTTLCNSILGSGMNITGSWATDTEMTGALKTDKSFLASSVTVSCKPSAKNTFGDYQDVKKSIEKTVAKEVEKLYRLGFRGADLLTACFGQAVSEFGQYEKVEKADGSEVTVAELLEMARESAFNALLKGFEGDDFTKFYIGWLQLYGFAESEHNTAMRIAQVGLTVNISDIYKAHILLQEKDKATLANYAERNKLVKDLGEKPNSLLIDQVHRAMALYKGGTGAQLYAFIAKAADESESSFWRVLTSLKEILPSGSDDYIQATRLLTDKDSLIRESKKLTSHIAEQTKMFE